MTKYRVTFKGEAFDISIEGDSAPDIAKDFLRTKEEIESIVANQASSKPVRNLSIKRGSREAKSKQIQAWQELSLSDLAIPQPVKDAFVENKAGLSNWDTLFLLLHYHPTGITNKQLRSLAEEIRKPIKYSWFDSEFHRRENEGLVMSKRQDGKREALYFLTEPGKKEAEALVRTIQTRTHNPT